MTTPLFQIWHMKRMNLIHSIKKYRAKNFPAKRPKSSFHISDKSLTKEAIIQLQHVSSWKISFKFENFETPIKEKIYPAPICATRRLLFDGFDNRLRLQMYVIAKFLTKLSFLEIFTTSRKFSFFRESFYFLKNNIDNINNLKYNSICL